MPNTKTKKFDFQIFLAVSLILLVICCATACIVLSNNENGVAFAQGEEVVTNLQFSVTNGFYVNKLTSSEFEKIFEYFTPYTSGDNFSITSISGYFHMNYNGSQISKDVYFHLNIGKVTFGSQVLKQIEVLLDNYADKRLFMYSLVGEQSQFESSYTYIENAGDYFFDIVGSTSSSGTFANQLVNIFGLTNVQVINSLDFTFYNTSNLGCLISPNHTFANPIVASSYEQQIADLTNQITNLNSEIDRLNGVIQDKYQEGYDDGVLAGSQFYRDMTYNESLYRNNESSPYEIYSRNILDLTDFLTTAFDTNSRWHWCTSYTTTSIGGGVLYYPAGEKNVHLSSIGEVLTFYKENNNNPIYCIYDGGASALHKFDSFVYIIDGYDFSIMLNDGYALGYQQGINAGNKASEEQLNHYKDIGFDEGKSIGYQLGKNEGYNQGVLDANDYSFFSLFSAVFDAPITAIVGRWGDSDGDGVYEREGGMLNFYIPGLDINFAPFLLSIFTLAIIVMIIRFILARKS